jgi:hypothetical protein
VAPADLPIRLTVPARHEYGRVARLAAWSMALRLGYPHQAISDLALAIDEMMIYLLRPEGAPGRITITMRPLPEGLEVAGSTSAGSDQHWDDAGARTRFEVLVDGIVDEWELGPGGAQVRLLKQRPAA